jgi:hypothetical protein
MAVDILIFFIFSVEKNRYENIIHLLFRGSVPEWLKGTGCKPVGESLRWFESSPAHYVSLAKIVF